MWNKVPNSLEEINLGWLQEAFKQSPFEITNYSWKGIVGEGLGQMSTLTRLTLYVIPQSRNNETNTSSEIQEFNVIVKTLPVDKESLRAFIINEGFCHREYNMYAKVFPSWERYQDARNTPDKYRFKYPKCYYAAEEGSGNDYNMILILEDLNSSGYHTFQPGYRQGVRWREAKRAVREMALFHAVGMAYKDQSDLKHYSGEGWDFLYTHSKDQAMVDNLLVSGKEETLQMLRSSPSVPEGLLQDLESFCDVKELQRQTFPQHRKGTICHNDLHINNVMLHGSVDRGFLSDDSECVVFDFQGCTYANPMVDLSFFLFLSCDPQVYSADADLTKVLKHYMEVFNEAMNAMDCDISYSSDEILNDFRASVFNSVIHIILGSLSWSFGSSTGPDSRDRLRSALLFSYDILGHHLTLSNSSQDLNNNYEE